MLSSILITNILNRDMYLLIFYEDLTLFQSAFAISIGIKRFGILYYFLYFH